MKLGDWLIVGLCWFVAAVFMCAGWLWLSAGFWPGFVADLALTSVWIWIGIWQAQSAIEHNRYVRMLDEHTESWLAVSTPTHLRGRFGTES